MFQLIRRKDNQHSLVPIHFINFPLLSAICRTPFPFISSSNEIYKYGGYGFWQTNGLLIFYDRHKKEWEFTSLNADIKSVGCSAYFDKLNQKLYQFGSLDFNQTLWNPSNYLDSIFELDLQSKKWIALGKINNEIKRINVLNALIPNGLLQPFPNGFIYLNDDGQSFVVDFIQGKFILFNEVVNDLLKSYLLDQRQGKLLVSQQNGLTLFDKESLREIKSVEWAAILNGKTELTLLQPVSKSVFSSTSFKIIIVAILFILTLLFLFKKRRTIKLFRPSIANTDTTSMNEKIILITDGHECLINGKKASEFLNDQELSCLSFITVGMKNNNLVTTVQLNDHLNIDSKTPDYQKKTRSDLIKSINYKVRANTKFSTGDLVSRRQSQIDKRMVIYEISSEVNLETPTSSSIR